MTPERYARICEMLAARQPDLTVCMEQVHKPHNVSAVIRTADAVGVNEVHAVWPTSKMRTQGSFAAGANSWVQVKTHKTIQEAVAKMKAMGMQVLATNLSEKAVDRLYPPNLHSARPGKDRHHARSAGARRQRHHYSDGRHGSVAERFRRFCAYPL
jgi:tRNA G18 (ribose-2'-O)-methylase SpoU